MAKRKQAVKKIAFVSPAEWIWMPHAGHLIVGNKCQFHLCTYVNGYIVSTVGEYWPERSSREIHARVRDPKWHAENGHRMGDDYDYAYMKRFGFVTIGAGDDSLYETMVFTAKKSGLKCCPYKMKIPSELNCARYATADAAREGHMNHCHSFSMIAKKGARDV